MTSPGSRRAVLVLGPHRSGTSALTGVLSRLGVFLGEDLLPPNVGNPRGFSENVHFVRFHDRLLAELGSHWHDPRPLLLEEQPGFVQRQAEVLAPLIESQFAARPLFGVKDPRMCRLVPVWLRALEALGVEPCAVLAVRSPTQVAASLAARDGFHPDLSHALWTEHVLAAERDTRGLPRAISTFGNLLDDWRATVDRIQSTTQLPLTRGATEEAHVDAFLTKDLDRQGRARPESPERHLSHALYEELRDSAPLDPDLPQRLDRLCAGWTEAMTLFARQPAAERAQLQHRIEELETKLRRSHDRAERFREDLDRAVLSPRAWLQRRIHLWKRSHR